ncbi:MAG: TonB-dependent receptor [Gemmatimonadaceae bacterium]|nr:TonB-dependent receptor [Gemmatimonadaceae bacterium]
MPSGRGGWRALALATALTSTALAQSRPVGALAGTVRDSAGLPVPGARVTLAGTARGTLTRDDGRYQLVALPPGRYALLVRRVGFAPSPVDSITIADAVTLTRDVVLRAVQLPLSQIVITPGSYSVLDPGAPSQQVLTREELLTRPQLAEDLFRSLNRLPGFSGSDFSSQLRIRNGAQDELLVTLDGMELVEPFHLKDFDGALTILDQEAIGRVEVNTGGFGATYGNRASGLLLLQSATPTTERTRTAFGLSLSNLRARTEGTFANGKGSWMVSGRRGFLDLIFRLVGEDDAPDPTYYDVFGKAQYQLGTRHVVALHTLVAGDALQLSEDGGASGANSHYGNNYLWTTVRSQWTPRIRSTTLAARTGLSWDRDARLAEFFNNTPFTRGRVRDLRTLEAWTLKQDWVLDAHPRLSATFGGEWRSESATFDYDRTSFDRARFNNQVTLLDSTRINIDQRAAAPRLSGYATTRVRPWSRTTLELGARADYHGWTSQATVVPRGNVAVDLTPRTVLRAAWGVYAQAQGLQELGVLDGDSTFARAERSEQRVLSLEHRWQAGWTVRTEAFARRIQSPRPRWYNADGDIDLFPEGQNDRVRIAPDSARVAGVEALATFDRDGRVRATLWYSRLTGRARSGSVVTPRAFEEPHSGAIDVTLRRPSGWSYAWAYTFHSGWPSIPGVYRLDTLAAGQYRSQRVPPQPIFTDRLPTYQRVDIRMSRRFVVRRGAVSVYGELFNLFARGNQRGWSYQRRITSGRLFTTRTPEYFLGRLPTLGARWEF